jgi:aryl-alcohol dehydrogenase-like predicted oxidoreductase
MLQTSEVGMGMYALAGVYGQKDLDEFRRVLRRAFDLGVTFFDTAPIYGDAEEITGEILADVRQEVVLSTKIAACLKGELSCSFDHVIASCEQSLARLKTDYIDLLQIHFDDGRTPAEEVIRAFEHLRNAGKIRAYGIGHVTPARAREYADAGNISTIMGELNATSRKYYFKMLPVVRAGGAGYIGFSTLGRGILTGAVESREGLAADDIRQIDAVFAGERLKSALRIRDKLAGIADRLGATPVQVAIRWVLAQDSVVTALVGPSTVRHLEEDAGAIEVDIPEPLLSELDGYLVEEETGLADTLKAEIVSILTKEIADSAAARDLIYAIEGLAELDLAPEHELVGHIRTVLGIMMGGQDDMSSLEPVRKDLLRHVKAA